MLKGVATKMQGTASAFPHSTQVSVEESTNHWLSFNDELCKIDPRCKICGIRQSEILKKLKLFFQSKDLSLFLIYLFIYLFIYVT